MLSRYWMRIVVLALLLVCSAVVAVAYEPAAVFNRVSDLRSQFEGILSQMTGECDVVIAKWSERQPELREWQSVVHHHMDGIYASRYLQMFESFLEVVTYPQHQQEPMLGSQIQRYQRFLLGNLMNEILRITRELENREGPLELAEELERLDFQSMLSGPYDSDDVVLAVHAGAGGTDAQDWAEMLHRMYLRWAESRGFGTEIYSSTEGDEAGIDINTPLEGR